MTRQLISSGSQFEAQYSYSRAVVDGDYVFVSGTTGYNYQSMSISDDVAEQAEQCFKNIAEVLEAAGSSLEQVVRVRYILPDRHDLQFCAPVINKYLQTAKPAATMFVAGLLNEEIKIEIEVTARITKLM